MQQLRGYSNREQQLLSLSTVHLGCRQSPVDRPPHDHRQTFPESQVLCRLAQSADGLLTAFGLWTIFKLDESSFLIRIQSFWFSFLHWLCGYIKRGIAPHWLYHVIDWLIRFLSPLFWRRRHLPNLVKFVCSRFLPLFACSCNWRLFPGSLLFYVARIPTYCSRLSSNALNKSNLFVFH